MWVLFLLALNVLLVCSTQAVDDVSRNVSSQHWFKIKDKDYFIEENFKGNYLTAMQYCNYHNMQLVALDTEEENTALFNQVADFLVSPTQLWTSGTRLANGDDWVWMSIGKPAKFFNWGNGEPNNENNVEKCVTLYYLHYQTGWWNDVECFNEFAVVCESKDC